LLLVVDNGSIYTKNLTDFLNEKDIFFEKQIPQLLDLNSLGNYDSVILSGRRRNEKKIIIRCISLTVHS
jgi:GMP synthase (glutamine-hydrolysing)